MGEAWFMSLERRMYAGLLASDPHAWVRDELRDALEAIVSGPGAFGHMEEWSEWFGFLLHASLPLTPPNEFVSHYELLVSAVMVHCPDAQSAYAAWLPDILCTLGQCLFDSAFWKDGQIRDDAFFAPLIHPPRGWMLMPGGAIPAAFHLVAKYLDEALLPGWMTSVMAIDDVLWRAKIAECLAASAKVLLEDRKGPADWDGWVGGGWNGSHLIRGTLQLAGADTGIAYMDVRRRATIIHALRLALRQADLAAWGRDLFEVATASGGFDDIYDNFESHACQIVDVYGLRP